MSRVALIDDSRSSLRAMETLLGSIADCEAIAFSDPREGLAWCIGNELDLIVVDYVMPGLNGLQFIGEFRSGPRNVPTPILMITSSSEKDVRYMALQMGASDFLLKPVDEVEFLARVRNLLELYRTQKHLADRSQWLAEEVRSATRQLVLREREAVLFLGRAAEHRDPETGRHLVRMADYSRIIAERLGLDTGQCEIIHTAAPLHDLGKIAVPDRILLKPGRLDEEETRIMRQHTVHGHEILAGSTSLLLQVAAEIAVCHHERFDGLGYPRRIAGEDIPLVGRIVALADVFDALTTDRPYKAAWSFESACSHIAEASGSHFDPACVNAALSAEQEMRGVFARQHDDWTFPTVGAALTD